MAVYLEMIDLMEHFNQLSEPPIIVNDIVKNDQGEVDSSPDKDKIRSLLMSEYTKTSKKFTASCLCGLLQGDYRIGEICPKCNSTVKEPYAPLESKLWIRRFDHCAPFINPIAWMLVRNFLMSRKKHKFDVLAWLSNTRYSVKDTSVKIITDEIQLLIPGLKRDYNYLADNFIDIVSKILFLSPFYSNRKTQYERAANQILDILHKNRHKLYTDYIPIPHKSLIVSEKTKRGTYMDYKSSFISAAILTAIFSNYNKRPNILKNRMSVILTNLADFYGQYFKMNWGRKPGIFRRHISGTRTCFSFRCVVTPLISGKHDEIHIPWKVAIIVLRPMIENRLIRTGIRMTDIEERFIRCFYRFDPEIYSIIEDLIEECPYKGLPSLIVRNPTLKRGSIMRVFITKVKKDIDDHTISYLTTIAKIKNGDFDGDEENVTLLLDRYLTEKCETMSPNYNILDPTKPYSISSYLFLPKPCIATIMNTLARKEETPMPEENLSKLLEGIDYASN